MCGGILLRSYWVGDDVMVFLIYSGFGKIVLVWKVVCFES